MNYLNTKRPVVHFRKTLASEIYVDKSLLISKLNKLIDTGNCYICVTRPRRFGKSINANMLGAYYTTGFDTHKMFVDLAIAKEEKYGEHLNKHNVLYIDFSQLPDECGSYQEYINTIIKRLKKDLQKQYPDIEAEDYA